MLVSITCDIWGVEPLVSTAVVVNYCNQGTGRLTHLSFPLKYKKNAYKSFGGKKFHNVELQGVHLSSDTVRMNVRCVDFVGRTFNIGVGNVVETLWENRCTWEDFTTAFIKKLDMRV
jgi:hypothetical protein